MAIAMENSVRSQPNSSATGIWKIPKEARTAKLNITIMQPAIKTGVTREVDFMLGPYCVKWYSQEQ
jgi:hypothetical protein